MGILLKIITVLAISATAFGSIKIPDPPESSYKNIGLWRNKVIFEFKGQPLQLTEPTYLSADEVIIATQIVTNGYEFKIDTKNLVFKDEGEIIGFTKASEKGLKGRSGDSAKRAKKGGDGKKGSVGSQGLQLPGAVIIFASNIEGTVKINGIGQQGGLGGDGGNGAMGGKGINGKNADVKCYGPDKHGTNGKRGSQGGLGGQGGDGGQAGRRIPVIVLTNNNKQLPIDKIISLPGYSGRGGEPGQSGAPGKGGEGGLPDTNKCDFFHGIDKARAGRNGPEGKAHSKNHGQGVQGLRSDDLVYLPESLKMLLNIDIENNIKQWSSDYIRPQHKQKKPGELSMVNNLEKEYNGSFIAIEEQSPNSEIHFFKVKKTGLLIGDLYGMEKKRQKLHEPWRQFHLARVYYLLMKSSLNIFDINETMISNEKKELSWQLSNLNFKAKNLKKIWQLQFLDQINQSENWLHQDLVAHTEKTIKLLGIISEGNSVEDIIAVTKFYKDHMDEVKLMLNAALKQAVNACVAFTQEKKDLTNYIFKFTSHFNVPICNGEINFSDAKNVMAEIRLFKNHHLAYKPSQLVKYKVNQVVSRNDNPFIKYLKLLNRIVLSEAYAEAMPVESDVPLPEEKNLLLVGFSIDKKQIINLQNIKKSLHVLTQTFNKSWRGK